MMKRAVPGIFTFLLFILVIPSACGVVPTRTPTPELFTITLKGTNSFDIRVCPFALCEKIYQLEPGDTVGVIAYDGRSTDLASRTVWLQVVYEGDRSGWMFANPNRIEVPDGMMQKLPVAIWEDPTPVPTPTGDPAFYLKELCAHNVYEMGMNPNLGKTYRFKTPIQIDTHGIFLINEAVHKIESLTNGLVTFEIVDYEPTVGIIVSEGANLAGSQESISNVCNCGGIGPQRLGTANGSNMVGVGEDGYINTQRFFHYGGPSCDLIFCNWPYGAFLTRTSMEEHELAHAIGLGKHFDGFTGYEGFSRQVELVASELYRLPAGTDMTQTCATFYSTCPAGVGPGGITAGFYDPMLISDAQRQWLWKLFGYAGTAGGEYGGEMCNGGTPYLPMNSSPGMKGPTYSSDPVNHPCPASTGSGGRSAIVLDGLPLDWLDIPPLITDGQDSGPYDFAALYACSDETDLYLRIDPYGSFDSSVTVHFAFDIVADGASPRSFQASTNDFVNIFLMPLLNNTPLFDQGKYYRGVTLNKVLELVIPLVYLGNPDVISIHSYANDGVNPMPVYDYFEEVKYLVKNVPVAITPTSIPSVSPAATPTP